MNEFSDFFMYQSLWLVAFIVLCQFSFRCILTFYHITTITLDFDDFDLKLLIIYSWDCNNMTG